MAALGDEVLDGYMYPACVPYSYPYPYPPAAKSKGAAGGGGWRPPSGAPRPVRFARTVAVYSPVASRRLTTFLEGADGPAGGPRPAVPEGERRPPPLRPRGPEEGEGSRDPEQPPPVGRTEDAAAERSSPRSPEQAKERPRFQFLEQKYGYYHCKDCNIRWESAYVWCVQGTNKVYFKQFCRTCQKSYNPYRVEDITCQSCKQTRCSCSVKLRHVDPTRPHRQDLCGRCKGKRLSCDSTFSFKYII
uniref:Zygote arrest 1 n=1 Tax=Ursus americanus TaxID=9643 RepID=A0A452QH47_URSAM